MSSPNEHAAACVRACISETLRRSALVVAKTLTTLLPRANRGVTSEAVTHTLSDTYAATFFVGGTAPPLIAGFPCSMRQERRPPFRLRADAELDNFHHRAAIEVSGWARAVPGHKPGRL